MVFYIKEEKSIVVESVGEQIIGGVFDKFGGTYFVQFKLMIINESVDKMMKGSRLPSLYLTDIKVFIMRQES